MIERSKKFKNQFCHFERFFSNIADNQIFPKKSGSATFIPLSFSYNLKSFLHVLTYRHMKLNFKEFPVIVRIET